MRSLKNSKRQVLLSQGHHQRQQHAHQHQEGKKILSTIHSATNTAAKITTSA